LDLNSAKGMENLFFTRAIEYYEFATVCAGTHVRKAQIRIPLCALLKWLSYLVRSFNVYVHAKDIITKNQDSIP